MSNRHKRRLTKALITPVDLKCTTFCPGCGYGPLDAAHMAEFRGTGGVFSGPPKSLAGHLTLCACCGLPLIFTDAGDGRTGLRAATDEELPKDSEKREIIEKLRHAIRIGGVTKRPSHMN